MIADSATTYLTLLSGYSVLAYLLGNQLAKRDLMILNGLYIAFILATIQSLKTAYSAGRINFEFLLELDPSHEVQAFSTLESMKTMLIFFVKASLWSLIA